MTAITRHLASIAAAGLVLTGCGASVPSPSARTSSLLHGDMAALASAAASKNYRAATAALQTLTADATAAAVGGTLDTAQLTRIRSAAAAVAADLAASAAAAARPTPAPVRATPTPKTAPPVVVVPSPWPGKTKHGGDHGGGGGD